MTSLGAGDLIYVRPLHRVDIELEEVLCFTGEIESSRILIRKGDIAECVKGGMRRWDSEDDHDVG